jgi:aryl-alcohol dehydrogenase-like predicted oxidoreductase
VSEFGVGCARIGGIFQQDTGGFLNLLSAAYDAGITFFDTADMYSQGESEVLVGKALRRVRSRVVIASKAGYCLPARRKVAARLKPLLRPLIQALGLRRDRLPVSARGALGQDFTPAYLTKAVEASLRRLRTDYLDLLQLHSPPAEIIARGEWEPALEALKRAGKIRYYGISCDTEEAALEALRYSGVSSLQVVLNMLERRSLGSVLPGARAKGVAVIARECLANGQLAKAASELDLAAYCGSPEELRLREEQLASFRRQAAQAGRPLVKLALDYVRETDGVSVTLLGVRTIGQLRGLLDQIEQARAAVAVP